MNLLDEVYSLTEQQEIKRFQQLLRWVTTWHPFGWMK